MSDVLCVVDLRLAVGMLRESWARHREKQSQKSQSAHCQLKSNPVPL
jgi:hypothetical protein